jgi:hypothetical protein
MLVGEIIATIGVMTANANDMTEVQTTSRKRYRIFSITFSPSFLFHWEVPRQEAELRSFVTRTSLSLLGTQWQSEK